MRDKAKRGRLGVGGREELFGFVEELTTFFVVELFGKQRKELMGLFEGEGFSREAHLLGRLFERNLGHWADVTGIKILERFDGFKRERVMDRFERLKAQIAPSACVGDGNRSEVGGGA